MIANECFFCGRKTVVWEGDYTGEEIGREEAGFGSEYHCEYCGAIYTTYCFAEPPAGCGLYKEKMEE